MIEITRDYARYIFALESTAYSEGFLNTSSKEEYNEIMPVGIELITRLIKEFPDVAKQYEYMTGNQQI